MIKITDYKGCTHFVAHGAIAKLSEVGLSSQWRGIRCIVKLFDGSVIETGDTVDRIAAAVAQQHAEKDMSK